MPKKVIRMIRIMRQWCEILGYPTGAHPRHRRVEEAARQERGAQAVLLRKEGRKVLPGAGFGIPSRLSHLVQVIAFILAALQETRFIPAPSIPALRARTGVLWGVRCFLQAGLGEEFPSQICNVEKSIPRGGKVQ